MRQLGVGLGTVRRQLGGVGGEFSSISVTRRRYPDNEQRQFASENGQQPSGAVTRAITQEGILTVRQFLARQRGGRRRKGGIRAAARALGLTRHRLGPHHRGLYKGCSGEHT